MAYVTESLNLAIAVFGCDLDASVLITRNYVSALVA